MFAKAACLHAPPQAAAVAAAVASTDQGSGTSAQSRERMEAMVGNDTSFDEVLQSVVVSGNGTQTAVGKTLPFHLSSNLTYKTTCALYA